MATLQVKDIDNKLYEALKQKAELDHRSISQEVITIILDSLSQPVKNAEQATYDFLKLSGAWAGSESATRVIDQIRSGRKRHSNLKSLNDVFN